MNLHISSKISMYRFGWFRMNKALPNFLSLEMKQIMALVFLLKWKTLSRTIFIWCVFGEYYLLLFVLLRNVFHFLCVFLTKQDWTLLFLKVLPFKIRTEIYHRKFIPIIKLIRIHLLMHLKGFRIDH